jgi:hypothetical protein
VAGGRNDRPPEGGVSASADAEIFDPATGTFRATGSLHRARLMPAAVAVDDRVLVLGHLDPYAEDPLVGRTSEWFE